MIRHLIIVFCFSTTTALGQASSDFVTTRSKSESFVVPGEGLPTRTGQIGPYRLKGPSGYVSFQGRLLDPKLAKRGHDALVVSIPFKDLGVPESPDATKMNVRTSVPISLTATDPAILARRRESKEMEKILDLENKNKFESPRELKSLGLIEYRALKTTTDYYTPSGQKTAGSMGDVLRISCGAEHFKSPEDAQPCAVGFEIKPGLSVFYRYSKHYLAYWRTIHENVSASLQAWLQAAETAE